MTFSLTKNFLDQYYTPFTQKACEDVPQSEWVILVFLDNNKSKLSGYVKNSPLGSADLRKFFQCNEFYCTEDYTFRNSYFNKETPFWVLYFKTSKPISMATIRFDLFLYLSGVDFFLPLNFRDDSYANFEDSKEEVISFHSRLKDMKELRRYADMKENIPTAFIFPGVAKSTLIYATNSFYSSDLSH